jgi:hypothetical protein
MKLAEARRQVKIAVRRCERLARRMEKLQRMIVRADDKALKAEMRLIVLAREKAEKEAK